MSSEGVRITELEEVTTLRDDDFAMVDSPTRNESKRFALNSLGLTNPDNITELPEATTYADGMYYVVASSSGGTKKIPASLVNEAISDEATARSNADSTLQNNIDNLSNETIHIDSDGKFFVYVNEE